MEILLFYQKYTKGGGVCRTVEQVIPIVPIFKKNFACHTNLNVKKKTA